MPFALGSFLGPLLLGRLFDVVGRKPMIAAGLVEATLGVRAEQQDLESIARPLWAPSMSVSVGPVGDPFLPAEVERLVAALDATAGRPLERRQLAAAADARFWGPGRFRRALHAAPLEGRIVRAGRARYALPRSG